MTIQEAHKAAQAAIDALAHEGQRQASEHAYALDRLREEVAELRAQNATLRAMLAGLAPADWTPKIGDRVSCLEPGPDVAPVDTEAP